MKKIICFRVCFLYARKFFKNRIFCTEVCEQTSCAQDLITTMEKS
ncbi:MAG: hypothetical protein AABX10_00255 [Nanoarchaeota archaeon]